MTPGPRTAPEQRRLRRIGTDELTPAETAAIRSLLDVAFGDDEEERFTDEDWAHSIGGMHVVLDVDAVIVAHGSLVERAIEVDGRPLRTGYVEAVATAPDRQGTGLATAVMTEIDALIRDDFELGMLGTGSHHFYERLGWRTWRGPSSVRTARGERRTPDVDGFLLVLDTPRSPLLDLDARISCEWRLGDVW